MRHPLPVIACALVLLPAAAQAQAVDGTVSVGATVAPPAVTPPPPPPPPSVYVQPPQPVYVQAQPMPAYGYPVYGPRLRRRAVPYTGGAVPPNAHVEDRANMGLLIAGSITFGVSYVPSLFVGVFCAGSLCGNTGLGWMMLPVVGPLVSLTYSGHSDEGVRFIVLDALVQAGGMAMMIGGALARQRYLVSDEYARRDTPRRAEWMVLPGAPGAPAGASFAMTHF